MIAPLVLMILAAPPAPPRDLKSPCPKGQLPFKGGCVAETEVASIVKQVEGIRAACNKGDREQCVPLGEMYRDGALVPPSPEYAAKLFQYACDGKVAIGCATLGNLYRKGLGTARDSEKAAVLTELACNMGHALSCSNAGYLYEKGEGVTRNPSTAFDLYMKACNLGDQTGCDNAAILSYAKKQPAK